MLLRIFIILLFTSQLVFSQKQTIVKQYKHEDSIGVNKDISILFYADSTFLNFGLFFDNKIHDSYIWYTFGNFSTENNSVVLNSTDFSKKKEELIRQIKDYYGKRKDHAFIRNYCEFTDTIYKNYILGREAGFLNDAKRGKKYKLIK